MVDNTSVWGRKTARERYGRPTESFGPPPDGENKPQKLGDADNLQGPKYDNDTPNNWLRGGPNESAEGKPSFDKPGAGQKR